MNITSADSGDRWSDRGCCRHLTILLENDAVSDLFNAYKTRVTWSKQRSQGSMNFRPAKRRRVSEYQPHALVHFLRLLSIGRIPVLRNMPANPFSSIYMPAMLILWLLVEWPYKATLESNWSCVLCVMISWFVYYTQLTLYFTYSCRCKERHCLLPRM